MTPKYASGWATRMSQPPNISMPPATQAPFTAAMMGLYSFTPRSTARTPSSMRYPSISFTSRVAICFWSLVISGM